MDNSVRQQASMRARRFISVIALAACACPVLAAVKPAAAGAAPTPVAQRGEVGPRCSGDGAKPATMTLQLGKSAMMRLPEPLLHRSVGNPGVVQAMLVAPDTLYLAGIDIGTTNMIIQGKSGACSVVDIVVTMDAAAFQATLAALLPDEKEIRVTAAADALVLSGMVADAATVARVSELAAAFVRRPVQPLGAVGKTDPAAPANPTTAGGGGSAAVRVINMLGISAPQQVMLEVKVAEVSKTLLERIEAGSIVRMNSGSWAATLVANFLTGRSGGGFDARMSNGTKLSVEAQRENALVRILAEPNVMAISGQEGTFLAGGKIFIPVAQDYNKIMLEEREFGVGLRFTPTVLPGGRINLHVAPEVSELSREGVGFSAGGVSGSLILPLITTRRASTTVQLYDGQSFAIGGLIKSNFTSGAKGTPFLSEVPILGALFRSTDFQEERSELLFVITPHLVKPLPPNYSLPTDMVAAPSRAARLLNGRIEGQPAALAAPAAATAPAATMPAAGGFELK
ncbi:type II and III secretion system protein family protein [Massilia sp. DWR3-1-1]|uniref:type II and III secretion system protein family protein n=1 Tax=Massilia sp. DWR3-1-1 TaxID=2804559 RepID=UPI003CF5E5C1